MSASEHSRGSHRGGPAPEGAQGLPAVPRARRALQLGLGFVLAGAFYLLLIDTVQLPELYAGAGAALLAAIGYEAGREQGRAEGSVTAAWVGRSWRAVARVPGDVVVVSLAALAQLVRPRAERGGMRAVAFEFGQRDSARDAGRRALAEALGSLAPNTIILGIDPERDEIIAHQLRPRGGAESIDVLRLG